MTPVPVFDLHCDVLLNRFQWGRDVLRHSDKPSLLGMVFGKTGRTLMRLLGKGDYINHQCDIPLLAEAGYQRAILGFHSFFFYDVPEEAEADMNIQSEYLDRLIRRSSLEDGYPTIPHFHRVEPSGLGLPLSPQPEPGMRVSPGIEGSHVVMRRCKDGKVEFDLTNLAQLKPAYVGVVHGENNWAGTCSYIPKFARDFPKDPFRSQGEHANSGLTEAGIRLVDELVSLNIPVDIAHLNSVGLQQVCHLLARAGRPALCSHTGYRNVPGSPLPSPIGERSDEFRQGVRFDFIGKERFCADMQKPTVKQHLENLPNNHEEIAFRNISREDARCIAETNGVIGLMFAPMYLAGPFTTKESDIVARHIDALARDLDEHFAAIQSPRKGVEHIAIGTDYDGFIDIPSETRDCRGVQRVFLRLKTEHNWSDTDIARVAHGNAIRFFSDWSNPPYPKPIPTP